MSKMSWVHAELTEQAAKLGFESLEEAEANGYKVSMDWLSPVLKPDMDKQRELAHIAWETQRQSLITKLTMLEDDLEKLDVISKEKRDVLGATIDFLRGCHD